MNRDLNTLSGQSFDLVIVGGGVTGACSAWDAALRGLSVALIERGDFGQATSSNSLKTVHGGLRYLQDGDLQLVRRMIYERKTYLRIAPHLVHPLPCLMPTYKKLMKSKLVMGMALKLNDLIGFDRNRLSDPGKFLPNGEVVSREACLRLLPGVCEDGITGGVVWHDAQIFNTERLTLAFVRSAVSAGAVAANYVEATGLLQEGSRVTGVKARDVLTEEPFEIRGKIVLNAAGPWVDGVLASLRRPPKSRKFIHSLAMNLVTKKFIPEYAAGILSRPDKMGDRAVTKKGRVLFVSPWRDTSIVGTFHAYFEGSPDGFSIEEKVIQDFLDETNGAYPGAGLKPEDVRLIHRGFLPAVGSSSGDPEHVKLVRQGQVHDHRKEDGIDGLVTVVGVKYTSARHVAEKAVDAVFARLGREAPACKTGEVQTCGGQIERFDDFVSRESAKLSMLPKGELRNLLYNYGSEYHQVLMLTGDQLERGREPCSSSDVLRAQILYALRHEMAQKLSDVVMRRTGLGSAGRPDSSDLQFCAEVMAGELNWDVRRVDREVQEVEGLYPTL